MVFTGRWDTLMEDCDSNLDDYDFLSCHIEKYGEGNKDFFKYSVIMHRANYQPGSQGFNYDLCYGNVWNICSPLQFHASFIPFDNYQYLGELGDTWQNPIVYQDPNGSPLFNVWATTDMRHRIPILYETFVFRISFIIDVEKHYE